MNPVKFVANKAYSQYLQQGRGQLSPEDALWMADQYLEEHPQCTAQEAIDAVLKQLLYED